MIIDRYMFFRIIDYKHHPGDVVAGALLGGGGSGLQTQQRGPGDGQACKQHSEVGSQYMAQHSLPWAAGRARAVASNIQPVILLLGLLFSSVADCGPGEGYMEGHKWRPARYHGGSGQISRAGVDPSCIFPYQPGHQGRINSHWPPERSRGHKQFGAFFWI